MKVLIAEDDPTARLVLERTLSGWGYEVVSCRDGGEALAALGAPDPPRLAILDWMMPGLDGLEVCRTIRRTPGLGATYVILLTARGTKEDLVEGFRAGADDYVIKPFDRQELRARLGAGIRIVELEGSLAQRARDIESAQAELEALRGLLPACAGCGRSREDGDYRGRVGAYLDAHPDAVFTHWLCPECAPRQAREAPRPGAPAARPGAGPGAAGSPGASFAGTLAILGIPEVVQTVHRAMKTGRLRVTRADGSRADVFFTDGEVGHAESAAASGEEAFYELLAWREGDFLFEPGRAAEQTSIYRPAMGLLVEGLRRVDEGRAAARA
jgi:CheY-like chemotaxis protein